MSSSTHNFASSIDNCHINLKMLICMCFKSKVETSTYITRNKCTGLYWITFLNCQVWSRQQLQLGDKLISDSSLNFICHSDVFEVTRSCSVYNLLHLLFPDKCKN
ncbi:hypothetical protein KIL84_015418 [Mauremys mutica]|uniref:Uncharacterized protein n=1 Tax=Mauremys mutica TaxID=74926 RepID=A0A9D4ARW6_9SAUR|nr:hypothetical protein KIL84_015418 [Mauremys mutica]